MHLARHLVGKEPLFRPYSSPQPTLTFRPSRLPGARHEATLALHHPHLSSAFMANPAWRHRVGCDFESVGSNHHDGPIYAVSAGRLPRPVGSRYLQWRCLPRAASGPSGLCRADMLRHGMAALVFSIRSPSSDSIFRSPFRLGTTRLHVRLFFVTSRVSGNIHTRKRRALGQMAIRLPILAKI